MANRLLSNRIFSAERDVKMIYARFSIGATGDPTLVTTNGQSKGVLSVTRNGAGDYTIAFGTNAGGFSVPDHYSKLLWFDFKFLLASTTALAAPVAKLTVDSIATAGTLQFGFFDLETPALTELANGEVVLAKFEFGDSNAP